LLETIIESLVVCVIYREQFYHGRLSSTVTNTVSNHERMGATPMLNIKDPEAHELARQLSQETGESLTRAVTESLRLRLAQVRKQRSAQRMEQDLLRIGDRCAATLVGERMDHAHLLYDEAGLPK
jgi:antitoxin VapB